MRTILLAGLLPLIALALSVGLFSRRRSSVSEAIVLGSLAWSFAIAMGSETLSLGGLLTFESLLVCWGLAVAALALALLWPLRASLGDKRSRSLGAEKISSRREGDTAKVLHFLRRAASAHDGVEWIAGAALMLIAVLTLFIALASPPNNWDSQTYHLARIEHWIQNRSLKFYPTANTRQLMLPGLAEVLILQLRLLSGGDRLDNIVQWLAGAGSVIVVGRIALALGASRRGAALSRLTAASLPIGILESTSTQNDLVVTFFLLCMAERLLAWRASRATADAAFMAVAASLALATKGTAYLIGLPLGLWFLIEIRPEGRRALAPLFACALLLLLPNVPGYIRNLADSGSPIGTIGQVTNNADFGLVALVVNGARNLAINLATQDYPLNRRITEFVYTGLDALGLDTNDPDLSFPSTPPQIPTYDLSNQ